MSNKHTILLIVVNLLATVYEIGGFVFVGEIKVRRALLFLSLYLLAVPTMAMCDDASVVKPQVVQLTSRDYVDQSVAPKVDTSEKAIQTMAGTYNVSGRLDVPTPALPEI